MELDTEIDAGKSTVNNNGAESEAEETEEVLTGKEEDKAD